MRTSTVLVGLLGGALFTGTLVPPLYVALPQRFVEQWYSVGSGSALIGLCLALVAVPLTGFLAAWYAPDDGVRAGTIAGLVSTLVGGILIALPAAAIEACASLLSLRRTISAERMRELSAEAVFDGIWVPSAVAIALLVTGPALGAIGGVVFDLWRGTVSRTTRTIRLSWLPQIGLWSTSLAVFGAAVWSGHLDKTALPLLGEPVSWGDRNALTAPLVVAGAFTVVLLAWAVRDAVLLLRDRSRVAGVFWGALALSAPIVAIVAAGAVHTAGLLAAPPWLLAGAALTGIGFGAWDGMSTETTFEPLPRLPGELLGEALLTGVVVAGALVFVCGAQTIGSYTLGFPFVLAALENLGAVGVPPEDLVARVFFRHWITALLLLAVPMAHLAVAAPLWMVGRLARR